MRTHIHIHTLARSLLVGSALAALLALPLVALDEEPEHENTLRWSTASEVDNFGFDVFRSESEDGPFDKINDKIIPGAGTTDVPQKYSYVDTEIDPRTAYYYYVESVSIHGVRERFTPVIRAKAKIADEESAESEGDGDGDEVDP